MSLLTVIITAFALAMDALAVSLATGLSDKANAKLNARRCGIAFGAFQSGMTLIGWIIGLIARLETPAWSVSEKPPKAITT